MFVLGFPLLLVPFAIYNIIAFLTPGLDWTTPVTAVRMLSGQDWALSRADFLLALAILLLAVEIAKSTRIGLRSIIDHLLAIALFVAMLIEFLLVDRAGTSTFFLLVLITLIDVIAGFIVGIRSSRRQVEVENERAD